MIQGLLCKAALSNFSNTVLRTSVDNIYNSCLNDMFADNGDELSRLYTGTGALKSGNDSLIIGFTRTGKRTIAGISKIIIGMMDDARKSAARFYMNNFQDSKKQEIIDSFLGKLANQQEIRLHNPIREAVNKALQSR